jgi:hypothetical protein
VVCVDAGGVCTILPVRAWAERNGAVSQTDRCGGTFAAPRAGGSIG